MQLTLTVNFISSKSKDEYRVIHSKSDNEEIKINDKVMKLLEKNLKYFLINNSEASIRR